MQKPVDAKPIAPSDQSPLASAARAEAEADSSYNLRPVTIESPDGPSIPVYAPDGHSDDEVLRDLGLTQGQRLARERAVIEAAVEIYKKPTPKP